MLTLLHNHKPISRYTEVLCVVYTFIIHVFIGVVIGVKNITWGKKFTLTEIIHLVYGPNQSEWPRAYMRIIVLQWAFYQSLIYFIF